MSELLCSQQYPEREAEPAPSPVADSGTLFAESKRNDALSLSSAETFGEASELQCAPGSALSETDAAALFGHYSDAEASISKTADLDGPGSGQIHLNPAQIRDGARTLRDALGTISNDYQAIVRTLNQHPEMVRAVREVYDAEFSITGQGLVADLRKYLGGPHAELASALMMRAGISAGQKPPTYVKQTAKGQVRSHHAIVASPAVKVAVPGTAIRYSIAKDAEIYSEGSYYTYQWLCLNDPQSSKAHGMPAILWGPINQPMWSARWDVAGNHKIICRVQLRLRESGLFGGFTDRAPEYIEYQQSVHAQGDVLARAMDKLPARESPDAQLRLLQAYQQALQTAEKQPGSGKLDPKTQQGLDTQLAKLRERLASSEGHTRYPLKAVHVAAENAQVSPLNVFVAKTEARSGQESWTLVDITNPADRRLTGEHVGTGKDARQAIKNAIAAWDSSNRYPKGRLRLQVPAESGAAMTQEFQTDGMSFWDSIAEFFNQVGLGAGLAMLGAAVVATIAPDPTVSKVAAVLLWTSILAGTAGASISMIQRHAEGMSTAMEDAFDTLTIAGNILGARWVLGATVKGLSLAGSRMGTAIAIGRFGTDAAQGILMSVEYVKEYQQILADPDPRSRTDKLIQLLGKAALSGGMLILSMRGNKADLEQLNAQKSELGRLGHQGETIDLAKKPAEGTAAAPKTRVTDPIEGLYNSIDATENVAPPGWTFRDEIAYHPDATSITTKIVSPDGKTGTITRTYDPKTKTLIMEAAFLDELPSKIKAGVHLTPTGTPLVSYLTMRQMKMAGGQFANLKSVRMDHIQNLESLLHLDQLTKQGLSLDEAVAKTHSVQYATTSIQQSGHTIVGVRLEKNASFRERLSFLMDFRETNGFTTPRMPEKVKEHDVLLAKYNLGRSDVVLMNYDIHIDLAPHPSNPK